MSSSSTNRPPVNGLNPLPLPLEFWLTLIVNECKCVLELGFCHGFRSYLGMTSVYICANHASLHCYPQYTGAHGGEATSSYVRENLKTGSWLITFTIRVWNECLGQKTEKERKWWYKYLFNVCIIYLRIYITCCYCFSFQRKILNCIY